MAEGKRKQCNAPLEERRLVRNVDAIVRRQYPVVLIEHAQGYDSLTRFSLGSEVGVAKKRKQRDDGYKKNNPKGNTPFSVHLYHCMVYSANLQ